MHFKHYDCILSAFQVFWLIPVVDQNDLLMLNTGAMAPNFLLILKTFEVHSKWRNVEWYSKSILTTLFAFLFFWLHSNRIENKHTRTYKKAFQILTAFKEHYHILLQMCSDIRA